ncbi:hypothetical protein BP6252_02604 [Coleophoma cylindrospora]|uniref:Uncharacterized protein n=1 Tax=Coleophoma cylindrospora TaxID=1849047 RepID=A0A3D8SFU2_9HELO|nr:hypothetical protein BP6252_02604 [Coleophoma cylindrospora]
MTKGDSVSSSAAASVHPSPREKGDIDEAKTSAQANQGPTVETASTPATPALESEGTVDNGTPADNTAEVSQPMIKSTSAQSTNLSSGQDIDGPGNGVAAHYGTRSRNRTGASRPNYAEDKELEFDIEAPAKDKPGRKGGLAHTTEAPASSESAKTGSRKSGVTNVTEPDSGANLRSHSKEPIPGTSSFSAKPNAAAAATATSVATPPQPSKKRKAGVQSAANTNSATQSASQTPTAQTPNRGAPLICLGFRETNMLAFENCGARLKNKKLVADCGTVLEVNDHVYLVCEPPGEPYYLGRIMEFLHVQNDVTQPIDALRLNWYYRPKDIGRKVNDTRQVFASMHSDISPLTALRGKCQIKHRSQVENLDELRRTNDCFWYEKLYDRYIHRYYEVIPTSKVINVPDAVKKVLDDRWKFILVESGRGKELTSAVKTCRRCTRYCATNDSVDCAVCRNTYHMSCVNPPLLKKPSRGFAWACGPCSKAQEKKLEARNTPNINGASVGDDDDLNDEDEDFPVPSPDGDMDTGRTTPSKDTDTEYTVHPGTAEQIYQASLWPFRYLGLHCRVEDALDYDDRIYPRASSRLGPRHQANICAWPGRPVEYVKAVEIKKKYVKGGSNKKGSKLSEETIAAIEADKIARENRPEWVMDEPPGYIVRGEDHENDDPNNTARLHFQLSTIEEASEDTHMRGTEDNPIDQLDEAERERILDDYMPRAKELAKPLGLPELSTNLMDIALERLYAHNFDAEKALAELPLLDKKVFKEPDLSATELKKFEDGVSKYGSEWHSIKKHVKTVSPGNIVRFYYTWKKTDRGKQVWGSYSGRKGKKEAKKAEANVTGKLQDDVADDHDDSAFDNDKAYAKKRGFQCKFCTTRTSRQWRRAPNTAAGTTILESTGAKATSKDKGPQLMIALCRRCAELWRRYAIQWEDTDEVAKKIAQGGGRAWKRKIDEEVLKELLAANEVTNNPPTPIAMPADAAPAPVLAQPLPGPEPPRKRVKASSDVPETSSMETVAPQPKKKHVVEKPTVPPPPPPPEPPKPKILPCSICLQKEPMDQHLCCKDCRMTVHRACFGAVEEPRSDGRWVCPMCSNDKNPQVSIQYKCRLCPVEHTPQDFVEPAKSGPKKKSEKDKEREKTEREIAVKNAEFFRQKQAEANKPLNPREPLKRTANNNWVHVTCAVFTPEVKFGNAKALEPSEGIPSIPLARYDDVCKACKTKGGACIACHSCRAPVHVECANQAGFLLGFDIAPVKSSRRDQVNIVSMNGEIGTMTAAVWCKEHIPKTVVHKMHDIDSETKLTALQIYAQNFKQADLTLTGTVRKATLINQFAKAAVPTPTHNHAPNRRASTTNGVHSGGRGSISHVNIKEEEASVEMTSIATTVMDKKCITCGIDVTPKWHVYAPVKADIAISQSTKTTSYAEGGPVSSGPDQDVENHGHVALATAALHQGTVSENQPTEFQCHKCHIKKARVEASPKVIPVAPVAAPIPPPETRPTPPATPAVTAETQPSVEAPPAVPYAWTVQQQPYPSTSPYGDWPRPLSTTPQPLPQAAHLNGQSPRVSAGPPSQMNGQPPLRHTASMPQSPHQNGHLHSISNGYPPPSPHRGMVSTAIHLQNGGFPAYASTRPGYQHLTNGGPPPRAPEHPFAQPTAPMHPRPPYAPSHGSPPIHRETHGQIRDLNHPANGVRPHDNRVNGGASASPSLRNLLS